MKTKLNHNEIQDVIDELSMYYKAYRAIIVTLLVALVAMTLLYSFTVTQSVTRGLSPKCQILLEEADQRFATECR